MAKKKAAAALTLIALMLFAAALAFAQPMSLDHEGIRFYVPEGWQIITEKDVLEKSDIAARIGTSAEVMKAQFDAHGILLYALDPEGNAFVLKTFDSPLRTYNGDVYAFSDANREQFLSALLEANPGASGAWDMELNTFVCLNWQRDVQGVPVHTLAFQTLMYGRIISFECESFGAPPADDSVASLRKGARAILFLGAKKQTQAKADPAELVLPDVPPSSGEAKITPIREDLPLTVDALPLTIASSTLQISGTTAPGASLRYYMNGTGIERFKADEQGRFEIILKKFDSGENTLRIESMLDKVYGSISARITLDQAVTPAALLETDITCNTQTYDLYGVTLPDASVVLKTPSSSVTVPVQADGTFQATVTMNKARDYSYTFEISSSAYKKNKLSVVIHHEQSLEDAAQAFKKEASKAKSQNAAVQGAVRDLVYIGSQRYVLFDADDGESRLIAVSDFLSVDRGMRGEMLMVLTGDTQTYDGATLPTAEWFAFMPAQ